MVHLAADEITEHSGWPERQPPGRPTGYSKLTYHDDRGYCGEKVEPPNRTVRMPAPEIDCPECIARINANLPPAPVK